MASRDSSAPVQYGAGEAHAGEYRIENSAGAGIDEGEGWESKRFRKWQAFTIAALIFGYSSFYVSWACLSIAQPLIVSDLGYSNEEMGKILSISTAARIVPKVMSGTIVDFAGGKLSMLGGLLATGIATGSFSLGTALWWMILVWSVVRVVNVVVWPGVAKVAAKWLHHSQIGKLFIVSAVTIFFIITVCFFAIKDSPRDVGLVPPEDDPSAVVQSTEVVKKNINTEPLDVDKDIDIVESSPINSARPASIREVLIPVFSSPRFWTLLSWYSILVLLRQIFMDWTSTYLSQACAVSDSIASFGSAMFALAGGMASLLMGILNDQLPANTRTWVILPFSVLYTLSFAFLYVMSYSGCSSGWLALTLITSAGFFMMGPFTLSGALSLRFGGKRICATVSGLLDAGGTILSIFSGSLGGKTDGDSGWDRVFGIITLLSVLSGLLMFVFCLVEHFDYMRREEEKEAARSKSEVEFVQEHL